MLFDKNRAFRSGNGFPYQPYHANGVYYHIHAGAYPSRFFNHYEKFDTSDFLKLALVRDPVKRFLSCYSNRVGYYRELSSKHIGGKIADTSVKPDPDIHEFIENFETYRNLSNSISYHSDPMVKYLGSNSGFYTRVFRFSEIEDLRLEISRHVGHNVEFPRIQTGGEKISPDILSALD